MAITPTRSVVAILLGQVLQRVTCQIGSYFKRKSEVNNYPCLSHEDWIAVGIFSREDAAGLTIAHQGTLMKLIDDSKNSPGAHTVTSGWYSLDNFCR